METLRGAIQYINQLQTLLGFDPEKKTKERAQSSDKRAENDDSRSDRNENKSVDRKVDTLQKSCANMQLKNTEFSQEYRSKTSENDNSSKFSAFNENPGLPSCEFEDHLGQSRGITENGQDKVKVESFSPNSEYSNEHIILERTKKNKEDVNIASNSNCVSTPYGEKEKNCNVQNYTTANTRHCYIYDTNKNCSKNSQSSYSKTDENNSDCRTHFDAEISTVDTANNNCMYNSRQPICLAQNSCHSFDLREGFLNTDIPSPNWSTEIQGLTDDRNESDRKIFRKHQQFYHGNGSCMYSARTLHQNNHFHPYAKLQGKTENSDTVYIKVESQSPPPCRRNQEVGTSPYFQYQLRGEV